MRGTSNTCSQFSGADSEQWDAGSRANSVFAFLRDHQAVFHGQPHVTLPLHWFIFFSWAHPNVPAPDLTRQLTLGLSGCPPCGGRFTPASRPSVDFLTDVQTVSGPRGAGCLAGADAPWQSPGHSEPWSLSASGDDGSVAPALSWGSHELPCGRCWYP